MTNGSSERDKSSAQTPLWLPRGRPRGEPGGPPRGPRTTTAHMAAVRTGQCLSEVTALLPRLGSAGAGSAASGHTARGLSGKECAVDGAGGHLGRGASGARLLCRV